MRFVEFAFELLVFWVECSMKWFYCAKLYHYTWGEAHCFFKRRRASGTQGADRRRERKKRKINSILISLSNVTIMRLSDARFTGNNLINHDTRSLLIVSCFIRVKNVLKCKIAAKLLGSSMNILLMLPYIIIDR